MRGGTEKVQVLLLALLMVAGIGPSAVGGGDGQDAGGDGGPGPLATGDPWTDGLDDMSCVYRVQDVEVTGGAAHLVAGEVKGWIASGIITCPEGYRFDLLMLELHTPGNCSVEVSVLNASADPSEVGFANGTLARFRLLPVSEDTPDLSLAGIGREVPIRIQVNLQANGTDRPMLLSWTVYFVDQDEWRDDFLGMGKISRVAGINMTGGRVGIDLSRHISPKGAGDYEPFPAIFFPEGVVSPSTPVFYPKMDGTGYQAVENFQVEGMSDAAFHDLDGDGALDMVCALDLDTGSNQQDSEIRWGDGTGRWPASGKTSLNTARTTAVELGDVNGDGYMDLVFDTNGGYVFLNKGQGIFNHDPDITLSPGSNFRYLDTGDLNNDGYDDIVIHQRTQSEYWCFMGGPNGPDTTVDIKFPAGSWPDEPTVVDINQDGYMDVILATIVNGKIPVYYSGPDGPDTTTDLDLALPSWCAQCVVGDLNGDGFLDIVADGGTTPNYCLRIWKGGATGWSNSNTYDISFGSAYTYTLAVIDINKDGFDDIVISDPPSGGSYLQVFYGGTTWPTTPDITLAGSSSWNIAIAVPEFEASGYSGMVVTDPIEIPPGKKWDIAFLEGTVPADTTTYLSVLDGASGSVVGGCMRVEGMDVDLSLVDPSYHRSIKLMLTMTSSINTTSPSIDSITVNWMDEREWRDEFIGDAKVERSLNVMVEGGNLMKGPPGGLGPDLIFPALKGDMGYTTSPLSFCDACGEGYLGLEPMDFGTRGTTGAAASDVNGDGYTDVVFSVRQTAGNIYSTKSPLFLGGVLGLNGTPDHRFATTGASDVLLEDIDGDGHVDVVFSQEETTGEDPSIESILYWGGDTGWSDTPDLAFATKGASDVEAADIDGDGRLDLVFACSRDAGTATDSMVFLQTATGDFCATIPDHRLPTRCARAVAIADIDDDGIMDVVLANSMGDGMAEIGSYIYWGKAGGGFEPTPAEVATAGAEDVAVADLDGDGDLDLVFANHWDDSQKHDVDSYVYLNDGSGGFGPGPTARVPTVGAAGVTVADIDGTGMLDLVFSCQHNDTSSIVPSFIYLGGSTGWSSSPDVELPTEGASSVIAVNLVDSDDGGYLSHSIRLDDQMRETGNVHTFSYSASLGASIDADLMLIDADTWEVLGSTAMSTGAHDWDLQGLFRVKEHPVVRVLMVVSGLDIAGQFAVDQLWFNWTERDPQPPQVMDMTLSATSVYRTGSVDISFLVADEYDLPGELVLTVQERLNGTTTWTETLVKDLVYDDASGTWKRTVSPKVYVPVGPYDLRVTVMDMDQEYSPWREFPNALEVLNNLPTTPVVRIAPEHALTTSSIKVEFDQRSSDVETTALVYNYTWHRDGELVPDVVEDSVPTYRTAKGQNWSVEVRAWDGDDFSGTATAWVLIHNAPPAPKDVIPDPEMDEDTSDDTWVNLMNAFSDADGDPLTWSLAAEPVHLTVVIDPVTGQVTFTPDENWFGEEDVTFIASDGEMTASQTVTVMVHSVNDLPVIDTVNGAPPTGDPMSFTVKQNGQLVITYTVADIEGDAIQADVSVTTVTLDEAAGTITFEPGDAVGTFTFTLRVWDVTEPSRKVSIGFTIEVENENDPMDVPQINRPATGSKYKVNETFSLVGECFDPDVQHGQELTFTWTSNISGLLGTGASITVKLLDEGTHLITLTVSDGEFERSTTIEVMIERPIVDDPVIDEDPEEWQVPWAMVVGIVAALVVLGIVLFVFVGKRKTDEFEREMDELEEAETKKEALERTRDALRDLADEWEAEVEAAPGPVEAPAIEGTPTTQLSMEARVTEEASDDVRKLWSGISDTGPEQTEEEKEALRLENLKRKYQNTIGRLPYGIPSKELAGKEWVELAHLLATGEKRTVEGGAEVTNIDGRWYYSDHDDTGTFLKEHGAKEEPKRKKPSKGTSLSDEEMLRKLEERFVMGEISEDAYNELKRKYSG